MYLNECKVTTVTEDVELADENVLIHKSQPGEPVWEPVMHKDGGGKLPVHFAGFSGKGSWGAPQKEENVFLRKPSWSAVAVCSPP